MDNGIAEFGLINFSEDFSKNSESDLANSSKDSGEIEKLNIADLNLGDFPEQFREKGVFVHYHEIVQVGDIVEAIKNIFNGEVPKGTRSEIIEIIIKPRANERGFLKRIKIEGYDGEYNPKKFKKIEE